MLLNCRPEMERDRESLGMGRGGSGMENYQIQGVFVSSYAPISDVGDLGADRA